MNLPDINEMFPQEEPKVYVNCVNCDEEIFHKDDVYIAAGYPYCSLDCFANLALAEGNVERRIAGE